MFILVTLAVITISLAVTVAISRLIAGRLIWFVALAVPFAVSNAFCWIPVWLTYGLHAATYDDAARYDVAERVGWAPILVAISALPSIVVCLIFAYVLRSRVRASAPNSRSAP
jgi:hypothetical protein